MCVRAFPGDADPQIVELGTVNQSPPGEYLLRRTIDVEPQLGLLNSSRTGNVTDYGRNTTYKGIVNIPSSYATMLVRFAVIDNSTADIDEIHALQDATTLRNVSRSVVTQNDTRPAPPLASLAPNGTFLGVSGPERQLSFAASLIPYVQPPIYSQRYRVASILAAAGLYNGSYSAPSGVNLTEAAGIANARCATTVCVPAHAQHRRGHLVAGRRARRGQWVVSAFGCLSGALRATTALKPQGFFGIHYAGAAYVALNGYQQQLPDQTLYPGYVRLDAAGLAHCQGSLGYTTVFNLQEGQAILVSFSGKPVLQRGGFWSISACASTSASSLTDVCRR